jgi:hypothetical protein
MPVPESTIRHGRDRGKLRKRQEIPQPLLVMMGFSSEKSARDDGISIASMACMPTHITRRALRRSAPVIRWVLRRDGHAVVCGLFRRDRSYEVRVQPDWTSTVSTSERFRAATPALLRHAEVARRLREDGWRVADHGVGAVGNAA